MEETLNIKGIKILNETSITRKAAIDIVKRHLTDEQIDFILDDYLSDENNMWLQLRIQEIKGYRNIKVIEGIE